MSRSSCQESAGIYPRQRLNKLIINKDPDGSYRIQDRDTDIIDSGLSFEEARDKVIYLYGEQIVEIAKEIEHIAKID